MKNKTKIAAFFLSVLFTFMPTYASYCPANKTVTLYRSMVPQKGVQTFSFYTLEQPNGLWISCQVDPTTTFVANSIFKGTDAYYQSILLLNDFIKKSQLYTKLHQQALELDSIEPLYGPREVIQNPFTAQPEIVTSADPRSNLYCTCNREILPAWIYVPEIMLERPKKE